MTTNTPNGVYVVQVGPDISDEPVRWCFTDEADADAFAEALRDNAWVTYEPIATSLEDEGLVEAFGEDVVREAKRIAAA